MTDQERAALERLESLIVDRPGAGPYRTDLATIATALAENERLHREAQAFLRYGDEQAAGWRMAEARITELGAQLDAVLENAGRHCGRANAAEGEVRRLLEALRAIDVLTDARWRLASERALDSALERIQTRARAAIAKAAVTP